jgi:acyl dehydratase
MDRFFDDFNVGDWREAGTYTVSLDEILEFASRYDPQPWHLDDTAARHSPFKRLVASGWQTAAIAMKLAVESSIMKATGILGTGVDELRWLRPVYPNDTLRLAMEVVEKRLSAPDAPRGTMRVKSTLTNQRDELVYTQVATLVVARRKPE